MPNSRFHFQFSFVSMCFSTVAVLAVTYIGLIAVVMSYATLTVEFSQSVKDDESQVAVLESQYLNNVAHIQSMDFRAAGYEKPLATTFVSAQAMTALR